MSFVVNPRFDAADCLSPHAHVRNSPRRKYRQRVETEIADRPRSRSFSRGWITPKRREASASVIAHGPPRHDGRVPGRGVGAVGKSPAVATAGSLA